MDEDRGWQGDIGANDAHSCIFIKDPHGDIDGLRETGIQGIGIRIWRLVGHAESNTLTGGKILEWIAVMYHIIYGQLGCHCVSHHARPTHIPNAFHAP
ncbi:hypothetical protein SERLA73DRAFT_137276 [Serpula lacrymans var. lacrymans S7.3]|uniref:Uncharacterized protein n=2 Tax=Serpula lacrymans var. lacrymans TaxID=341189 RepID=F8PZ03_SERL3|nr:uncharacterized protein SERLADRAFT_390334 [Serpula lacrymans var. lacrymans S7.9]EGN99116.1 hypothetical protein SERLA73DRAFT_137276 [Serpula lacrymans var. lacrymans S7.3]EGO24685.1 hypothetical protein SERLADRAFT_390334 [Serpula lacrymans var. lacrymans S7.9]